MPHLTFPSGLHTLLKTEDENAKRAAEGALWSLEGEQKHLQHLKNSPSAGKCVLYNDVSN